MPVDKWGIPYIYPTKATAGLTGTGHGFFWELSNNFRDDEEAGMLRLGKETADCKLIDGNTGEWEFPYLTDGDGLDMSGPTGHHSGGETHGCEGFTYMSDSDFSVNPPRFRFRKETYHVQYNDHPDGYYTSPFATGPVANNWKGYCWIRYNKKDGISPGKDSVICEAWWNDNPVADITNWKMLKRVEDKGAGITNWGIPATCDGDDYQVGTWSNIQFRFKSSSSDFSLHPLEPETNDGENIHSIGEANMSFADSAERGYGYQARMPRDIEMKCLVKWDAGGRGKAHFKNISLREIDPTLSFDDTPTTPPPNEEPTETTEVVGFFKFQQDINHSRTSACAGAGAGGGGGSAIFYSVPAVSSKELSDSSTFQFRTGIGEYTNNSSSILVGKIIKQADVWLKKVGSPAATPTITVKIFSSSEGLLYTSVTSLDPSTLTTDFVKYTFDLSTNTHVMLSGESIEVSYEGTSSSNYVVAGYSTDTYANTTYYNWENGRDSKSSREWAADLWT